MERESGREQYSKSEGVMRGVRDKWRGRKIKIKKKYLDKNIFKKEERESRKERKEETNKRMRKILIFN